MHFDPALRDQVVARYKQLNLPTYWAGVNPVITADVDRAGNATNVQVSYLRNPVQQYLDYGRMYASERFLSNPKP